MEQETLIRYISPRAVKKWSCGFDHMVCYVNQLVQSRLEIEAIYHQQMKSWKEKCYNKYNQMESMTNACVDCVPTCVTSGMQYFLKSVDHQTRLHDNFTGAIDRNAGHLIAINRTQGKDRFPLKKLGGATSLERVLEEYRVTLDTHIQLVDSVNKAIKKYFKAKARWEMLSNKHNKHKRDSFDTERAQDQIVAVCSEKDIALSRYESFKRKEEAARDAFILAVKSKEKEVLHEVHQQMTALCTELKKILECFKDFHDSHMDETTGDTLCSILCHLESTNVVAWLERWGDSNRQDLNISKPLDTKTTSKYNHGRAFLDIGVLEVPQDLASGSCDSDSSVECDDLLDMTQGKTSNDMQQTPVCEYNSGKVGSLLGRQISSLASKSAHNRPNVTVVTRKTDSEIVGSLGQQNINKGNHSHKSNAWKGVSKSAPPVGGKRNIHGTQQTSKHVKDNTKTVIHPITHVNESGTRIANLFSIEPKRTETNPADENDGRISRISSVPKEPVINDDDDTFVTEVLEFYDENGNCPPTNEKETEIDLFDALFEKKQWIVHEPARTPVVEMAPDVDLEAEQIQEVQIQSSVLQDEFRNTRQWRQETAPFSAKEAWSMDMFKFQPTQTNDNKNIMSSADEVTNIKSFNDNSDEEEAINNVAIAKIHEKAPRHIKSALSAFSSKTKGLFSSKKPGKYSLYKK